MAAQSEVLEASAPVAFADIQHHPPVRCGLDAGSRSATEEAKVEAGWKAEVVVVGDTDEQARGEFSERKRERPRGCLRRRSLRWPRADHHRRDRRRLIICPSPSRQTQQREEEDDDNEPHQHAITLLSLERHATNGRGGEPF